jgi:hypothetical protein
MNQKIMESVGFAEEVKNYKESVCPMCKQKIKMTDFTDACSKREYHISGLCQKCQNEIFGSGDTDE